MKVKVTFKQLNSEFNKEYADEYHFGEESENNWKTNWESGFKVEENVTEITLKDSTTYALRGSVGGKEFNYSIPDMKILECLKESGKKEIFAVSNKLVTKTHKAQNERYKGAHYYFYLKDKEEFVDLNGIIIATQDFPVELTTNNSQADT